MLSQLHALPGSMKLVAPLRSSRSSSSLRCRASASVTLVQYPRRLTLDHQPSRQYKCQLPPFNERPTTCDEYRPGVWGFSQPLGYAGFDAGIRMTVVRLDDGSLWVHAPVGRTEELKAFLTEIGGPVAHIVVPNTSPEHSFFAAEWAEAYPDAQVWIPPNFETFPIKGADVERLVKSGRCQLLPSDAPPAWAGQIDQVVFVAGTVYCEAVFVVRNPQGGILLTSDTAFEAQDDVLPTGLSKFLAKMAGIYYEVGAPAVKPLFQQYKKEGQEWVNGVLSLDFDMLVSGHVSAPVTDAKRKFRKAFDFINPVSAA